MTEAVPCQIISIVGSDGHHGQWLEVMPRLLPGALPPGATVGGDIRSGLWRRRALFFLMIENHPFTFIATALIGRALRIPVAGVMFRAAEAVRRDRFKYRVKNLLFRMLRRLPNTRVITLLPFALEPRFAEVAAGWVQDPQLWDLPILAESGLSADTSLVEGIREAAQGRRVIVALGAQDRVKGFDYLARLWCEVPEFRGRFLVVAAGKVRPGSAAAASAFAVAGGMLINRRLEDGELLGLYEAADMVWSCYAPDYNQASGIFGRAFQTGVPGIVRDGAFLTALGAMLAHPTLAIPYDEPARAAAMLIDWAPRRNAPETTAAAVEAMIARTRDVFRAALGRGPVGDSLAR